MSVEEILQSLAVLRQERYEILSLSGGEPFAYSRLEELVSGAVDLGFKVTAITNATLLDRKPATAVLPKLALAAVSIDGAPETHNALRGRRDAFERAQRGIDRLRSSGVPFGIAFCVSSVSLADIMWVYDFAKSQEARLLQLRPLVLEGRARDRMPELSLSNADRVRLAVVAQLLSSDDPTLPHIQLDLVSRAALAQARPAFTLLDRSGELPKKHLSDLVNPLVVEADGRIVPFAYGFKQTYQIARAGAGCARGIAEFKHGRVHELAALLERTLRDLAASKDLYVDWYAELMARSHRSEQVSDPVS